MSYHVVFLKHILFFSFPSITYSLTRSDLIHIDPFYEDSDSLPSQVPSILNPFSHVLIPLLLHSTQPIHTDHSIGTDTLVSGTPEAHCFFMVP